MDLDRRPNRLKEWDYSSRGYYFVTMCSHDRSRMFGEIVEGEMVLNDLGVLVKNCWGQIPSHFEGVEIDEFSIMPNHVHGIIKINCMGCICANNDLRRGRIYATRTKIDRSKMLISKVVQNFKAEVSRKSEKKSVWQRSFYDEVIRNEGVLSKIRWYIRSNPKLWYRDRNNMG